MTVTLPRELEAFVSFSVQSGRYRDAEEVIRDALRHLEDEMEPGWLDREMREAQQSGPATRMTQRDWEDIRLQIKSK